MSPAFPVPESSASPRRGRRARRISDLELASRLSFFLWSSIPDDELLDWPPAASVERAGDARAAGHADARRSARRRRSSTTSPPSGCSCATSTTRRPIRGCSRISTKRCGGRCAARPSCSSRACVRENRSVLELLTADYTFVNERLARSTTASPTSTATDFRRVTLADTPRRGLLGQGSILTVTSYAHRTSPVLRGKWMLENVLGDAAAAAAAERAGAASRPTPRPARPLTMREAMVQHRANPTCASCHARMDPLGFAFENFDAVGRWRTAARRTRRSTRPARCPTAPGSTARRGLRRRDHCASREQFATTMTERLLTYALGRGVEYLRRAGDSRHHARRGRPATTASRRIVVGSRQEHAVPDARRIRKRPSQASSQAGPAAARRQSNGCGPGLSARDEPGQ